MTEDEKTERYLFDPAAPPAEEVRQIEKLLEPLRYRREWHARRRFGWRPALAAAAMLMLLVAAGGAFWLWTWPADRGWQVVSGPMTTLPVGQPVSTDSSLLVRVARIGWMRVNGGSQVTLLSTRSNHHRLAVAEGVVHVSVWAPPRSVAVRTPSGEVIDFGCEFVLRVDKTATSAEVVSGWVRLDNAAGEVLVPGGASSVMRRSGLPSVPLFSSATAEFRSAAAALEDGDGQALPIVLGQARRRDVLTLLLLARRGAPGRQALLARAAELMPPRSPRTLARARAGDDQAIAAWIDELPLPPRNWVPNWRDRLLLR